MIHRYVSTACQHDVHDQCRRTCKFCSVACSCPCHVTSGVFTPSPVVADTDTDTDGLDMRNAA
jgi:hypothetical protein